MSSYPAPPEQANLRAIATLRDAFDVPVGYSDHCMGLDVSLAAVALGASILERHLTLDRTLPGPDHAMSLQPDELADLVRRAHVLHGALGDGRKAPQPAERNTMAVARRSIVAARDLAAGDVLDAAALAIKRPGGGLPPARLDDLVGARLARPLARRAAHRRAPRVVVVKVAVVTGGRADYGLLRPTMQALHDDERFELALVAAAMHLSEAHGDTLDAIVADGFDVAARVPATPGRLRAQLGAAVRITTALGQIDPDLLLVLGDRYEVFAAALAATGLGVPIAHMHGGELSEGSLDDATRHCLTKLAHVHLVATQTYADRVRQLGEEDARIHVVGAAGLEAIRTMTLLDRAELAAQLGVSELRSPLVAVTLHPTSLQPELARAEAQAVVVGVADALDGRGSVVATLPNDDPGNAAGRAVLLDFAAARADVHAFAALGQLRYLSLLRASDAVVGNSSSAIIEAPSFRVPVVNVGDRQRGRTMAANIVTVPAQREAVAAALRGALEPQARAALADMRSPYGDGHVSARVLEVLAALPPAAQLRRKRFVDLPDGPWRTAANENGAPR